MILAYIPIQIAYIRICPTALFGVGGTYLEKITL